MAVLTLSARNITSTSATVDWVITGCGEIITEVGIANQAASNDAVAPSLIYDSVAAENLGGSGSVIVTPDMCSGGAFGCYGYGKDGNGYYWSAGGFQAVAIQFLADRPSDWSWQTTVGKGDEVNLTAQEWTLFCTRINAFRTYKGLSTYSFTGVISGVTQISASIVNAARSAISSMSPGVSLPSAVSSGDEISAAFFNGLKDSLNSIV